MAAHKDTSGYIFPIPVDDGTRICVKVVIPNMREHRVAFIGAIDALCHAYNWQSDEDHNALAAAELWRGLWSDMMEQFYTNECDDMSGCCYDTVERRITPDGQMEIRINGGAWIPDPNDPRITGIALPPPTLDDHHTKCDAASNAKQHLMDFVAQESEALGAAASVAGLALAIGALIVAFFFAPETIPLIVPLIIATVPLIFDLGQAGWDSYFTSDVWDKILCALYCCIGADGQFTDAQYMRLISTLRAKMPASVAKDAFINQVQAMGRVGINNAASYGSSADADCSSCDCDCDLSTWDVLECGGVIVARDSTSITVQAAFHDSQWQAAIWSGDVNVCCCTSGHETISGGAGTTAFCYNLCGEIVSCAGFNHCGLYPNGATSVNSLLVACTVPFTMKFIFDAPCE